MRGVQYYDKSEMINTLQPTQVVLEANNKVSVVKVGWNLSIKFLKEYLAEEELT